MKRLSILLTAAMVAASTAQAQQRPNFDVQLPADAGSYPTGTILITDIDTVWTAAGVPA